MEDTYSVFVRDLESRSLCLSLSRTDCLQDLKEYIEAATGLPCEEQCITSRRGLNEAACLWEQGITADSNLHLSGRLRGGKGGFGSLLRGSGKTAMTENEDACRDLSGRRLRLVNAEKNLQDWAAAEKQRREDKQAAKEERERVKADNRAEEAQTNLEAIQKDQKAVLSSVAKALESSRKSGTKRSGPEKTVKPATKKTRYLSDSEEGSEDEDDSEEDAETDEKSADKEGPALLVTKEVSVGAGNTRHSTASAAQITLAT